MTLSPASLSGRGLYLAKHLLLTAPDTPRKDISSHSLALPRPGGAPCLGEEIGAWRLREVRGSSWGQARYSLGSLPQFPPCQQVHSLPAGQVCGWDRELLHRFIKQNPRSRGGVETSLPK